MRKNLGVHTILIASALAMVAPFGWQIITSLKSLSSATSVPPSLVPEGASTRSGSWRSS